MNHQRTRIAFFCDLPPEMAPSFVKEDLRTLRGLGEVRWAPVVEDQRWRALIGPRGWLPTRQAVRLLRWCDVAVQWFAVTPGAALAARALGKPILIIPSGYDVAHEPAHDYGMMIDPRTRAMARATLHLATRVLALSRFQLNEVQRWGTRTNSGFLYLGADPEVFCPRGEPEPRALMVSRVGVDHRRKGLAVLLETARLLPEIPFVLVGKPTERAVMDELRRKAPANLELSGGLPHGQVAVAMQRAAVYVQLSFHESFGCAVAEAMMCGCTPVVTPCGALPEVVGHCGYYADAGDPEATAAAIRLALARPRGREAHDRAMARYQAGARREGLAREVRRLVSQGAGGKPQQLERLE